MSNPNISRVAPAVANAVPAVVSPEYEHFRHDWILLRDVLAGSRIVKAQGEKYLPKMPGFDAQDYEAYKSKALFFNMTLQTLNGMLGQCLARAPRITGLPEKFKTAADIEFTQDESGHAALCKDVLSEVIALGRCGVLVDAPALMSSGSGARSYAVLYRPEDCLDWQAETVNGKLQLTRVLLREFQRDDRAQGTQNNPWIGSDGYALHRPMDVATQRRIAKGELDSRAQMRRARGVYSYRAIYRELVLEPDDNGDWIYRQYVYEDGDVTGEPSAMYEPQVYGRKLDFIPFQFFSPSVTNLPDVQRSPLIDIAEINLSHYRTSAEFEHGASYTALPVYFAPGRDDDGAAEYHIGPSRVWEVPEGSEPGIVEYKGEGLETLQRNLERKEGQIAAIGGRLLPQQNRTSESDAQAQLRESNEMAIMLGIIESAEAGLARVVRWWLLFRGVPLNETESLTYNITRSGLMRIDARLVRAVAMLHDSGKVPLESLFAFLQEAAILDSEMDYDSFQHALNDPKSFINSPNVLAMQRGYPDRQSEIDAEAVKSPAVN
jgi:hypothetical protein